MDSQPRLFFLNNFSIFEMKRKLEKYRDNFKELSDKEKHSLNLEDVEEIKALIRAYHDDEDGAKLLFVYNPFVDLSEEHAYLLVKDPNILESQMLEKEKSTSRWNIFIMWGNCVINVVEEDFFRNMDQHIRYYTGIFVTQTQNCPATVQQLRIEVEDPTSSEESKKEERVAKLVAIYAYCRGCYILYPHQHRESPIPKLLEESGREIRRFGGSSAGLNMEEVVKFKTTIISDPRARKFELKLKDGHSIKLKRLVDLSFFEQFKPSDSSPFSNLRNSQNLSVGSLSTDSEARKTAKISSSTSSSTSVIRNESEKLELPNSQKNQMQRLEIENISISFALGGQTISVSSKENQKIDASFVQEFAQAVKMGYQWINNKNQASTNEDRNVGIIAIHSAPKNNQQTEIETIKDGEMDPREKMKTLVQSKNKIVPTPSEHLQMKPKKVQESGRTKTNPETDTLLVEKGVNFATESHAPNSQVGVGFVGVENVEIRNKNVERQSGSTSTVSKLQRSCPKVTAKPKKADKVINNVINSFLKRKHEDNDEGQLPSCSTTLFPEQRSEERASKKIANSKISKLIPSSKSSEDEESSEELN